MVATRVIARSCFVALMLGSSTLAAQVPQPPLTASAEAKIAAIEPKVVAWRRDIHQHPELGNREVRTAGIVAAHLRSLGIEVRTGVAHTGVVGVLRGGRPGPTVGLRADMDALPITERANVPFASKATGTYNGETVGVMHACGHDAHVAILMGVAEVLAGMRDELPGTVKFIFQPAEEGPPAGEQGGAELMVKEGVLRDPAVDAVFGLHIWSQSAVGGLYYTPRGAMASADDYRIIVRGTPTHGAAPWNGVDPIVTAAQIVNALQTIVSRNVKLTHNPAVVTVGKIAGGVRSNIVPEQVELLGTLRAFDPADRKLLHDRVRAVAQNTAEAMGAKVEVTLPFTTAYPVTYNDTALTRRVVPVLESVAGPGRVVLQPPVTVSEDFSFYAERVPGSFFFLGGRPSNVSEAEAPAHHTPDFFMDEGAIRLGVRAMTALAVSYLHMYSTPSAANR